METKRITAVVMCLIMVFVLLPNAAFAYEPTGVVVGGTDVSGGGYWLNDGNGGIETATSENYNVHYEASTSTLTLNDANITKNFNPFNAAIFATAALTINLIGSNTLSGADGAQSFGVLCNNAITIEGDGSLTATGGEATSASCGVVSSSVTIEGGMVTATGGDVASGTSCGVYGSNITIANGTVKTTGGKVERGTSSGVRGNIISISGGVVTGTGGDVATGWSNGVCGDDRIVISGGKVTAIGGKATISYGMYGNNGDYIGETASIVNITGSTVTATGGESTSLSYGMYGGNRVIIENSTVTANGGIATGGVEATRTSCGVYSNDVEIKSGTVNANGGRVDKGHSYGVHGYLHLTIETGAVAASGGTTSGTNSSSNGLCGADVTIENGEVTASGGTASGTGSSSFGVFGNIVGITGGTVLAKGNLYAVYMSNETTLSIFDDYATPHTIVVSENISGFPEVSPDENIEIYKYLRVAPGDVTISDVTVNGTQNSTITEANATIALSTKNFCAMNEGTNVTGWFKNMPKGLTASIKTNVATGTKIATVTFSGRPEETSTAVMAITVPSDKLTEAVDSTVAVNENARWNIVKPAPSNDYTPTQVTLFNDPYAPRATIWLAGAGLASDDRLITERNPQGAAYSLLRSIAGENEVIATYNISLKSGSKSTGNSMSLTFDLAAKYAGQAFTLVHQKANGTYEYFYAVADANGDLDFGPLFELSPFMLVRGTLAQTAFVSLSDAPKTGDNALTALWAALASTMVAALLLGSALRKRRN